MELLDAFCADNVAAIDGASMDGQALPAVEKEKEKKDYNFWCQFNEKPSVISGCPGASCGLAK